MNCEQFRINLNDALDARSSILLADKMKQHSEDCIKCRQYETSILLLHDKLFQIPRLQPSAFLMHQLRSISSEENVPVLKLSWKPELRVAAMFLFLALLAVACNWLFNGLLGMVIEICVVTIGFSFLFVRLAKPSILGKYADLPIQ